MRDQAPGIDSEPFALSRRPGNLPISTGMAAVAASLPRARRVRVPRSLAAVILCAVAATLYAWMRLPVANGIHEHMLDWCGRFDMQPQDWHCRVSGGLVDVAYLGGSLLIGFALALPGMLLAVSGRRLSAFVPLAVAALVAALTPLLSVGLSAGGHAAGSFFGISESLFGAGGGLTYWSAHAVQAALIDVVLLAVPALSIAFVVRPARRRRPAPLPRHAAWVATFAIAGTVVALRFAWSHFGGDVSVLSSADDWTALVTMALFASMLGTDRRFWPWAIGPVAVLLSLGPATAVMSLSSRLTALTWFSGVVPLVGVGLVASLWRPVALRVGGRRSAAPMTGEDPVATITTAPRRFRPIVALNAIAFALVALSFSAQRMDPLPIQIAVSLPTYLGERELAQDVRAKLNLDEALRAVRTYRAERGTYVGFDAATGESLAPALAWSDVATGEELVVRVTAATKEHAQVVAASASGAAFCLQARGGIVTYGSVDRSATAAARASCASMPWTPSATRMFDVDAMCDVADDQSILICRAVQQLIRTTLSESEPS